MKEIIKYTLVFGRDREDLIDNVNSRIKAGWQPYSGITMKTYTTQLPDFYQTMVKYKPEPKNSI